MKFVGRNDLELMRAKTLLDEVTKDKLEDVKDQTLSFEKVGDKCMWTKIKYID